MRILGRPGAPAFAAATENRRRQRLLTATGLLATLITVAAASLHPPTAVLLIPAILALVASGVATSVLSHRTRRLRRRAADQVEASFVLHNGFPGDGVAIFGLRPDPANPSSEAIDCVVILNAGGVFAITLAPASTNLPASPRLLSQAGKACEATSALAASDLPVAVLAVADANLDEPTCDDGVWVTSTIGLPSLLTELEGCSRSDEWHAQQRLRNAAEEQGIRVATTRDLTRRR